MAPIIPNADIPLQQSNINLDISGVAGFFGGDVAVSAMGTVHIYKWRRWLGWYNSPGSYEIAKRYGQLARARVLRGFYPGVPVEPATLFELDGRAGPRYRALQSGTVMAQTGHLAHLLLQKCKKLKPLCTPAEQVTAPIDVSVVHLHHIPRTVHHPHNARASSYAAFVPIVASIAAAVACMLCDDRLCFWMIVLGMLCSGISCYIIGRGVFTFKHPKSAPGAPPGDGILDGSGANQMVVVLGRENAVNCITRGQFSLEYSKDPHYKYYEIGISSILLTGQFLAQLLIVPQGTIFGQVMFLCSLAVSWMYNSYLSSLDKESIQERILVKQILRHPFMCKVTVGTRTSMAVFVLFVLATSEDVDRGMLSAILNDLLPNDTRPWRMWKNAILEHVEQVAASAGGDARHPSFEPDWNDPLAKDMTQKEKQLLEDSLYPYARAAHTAFEAYQSLLEAGTEKERPQEDESGDESGSETRSQKTDDGCTEKENDCDDKATVVETCSAV
ncbi:hypothetical protein C8Q80DRAFT_695424 [Daedaleopsis nitida]|nr:hypothetical protein C8Q80DRAFT_695424 [Daedaleopsis nitida]